jgi:hypothetical protein
MTSSVHLTISFISHITLNLLKVFLSPFRQNLTIFGQLTSGIQLTCVQRILEGRLVLARPCKRCMHDDDWDPHVLHSPGMGKEES